MLGAFVAATILVYCSSPYSQYLSKGTAQTAAAWEGSFNLKKSCLSSRQSSWDSSWMGQQHIFLWLATRRGDLLPVLPVEAWWRQTDIPGLCSLGNRSLLQWQCSLHWLYKANLVMIVVIDRDMEFPEITAQALKKNWTRNLAGWGRTCSWESYQHDEKHQD